MSKTYLLLLAVLLLGVCTESKKFSWGRGSNSRRTSYKPAPTSSSGHAQSSISKPLQTTNQKSSFSGWQETPKQASGQTRPSQTHSYPSSQTGLSGNENQKSPTHNQESLAGKQPQTHGYPASQNSAGSSGVGYPQQQGGGLSGAPPPYPGWSTGNQPSRIPQSNQQHPAYPASPGLSGGTGSSYPQQQGGALSGRAPPYSAHPPGQAGGYSSGANVPGNHHGPPGYHHPQGAPPPYSPGYGNQGYGSHGYGSYGAPGPQMPGYYGNYGNKGFGSGMSRSGSALTGVGIAGAGIGTVLTGLALWNLARSTGRSHHTVIYDQRGQPVAVAPSNDTGTSTVDPMLADLVNCTLTIAGANATEVLAIPCSIATSFSPEAEVQELDVGDSKNSTKCTITVVTKAGREFMTTIPCSVLLNSAAENNVTEPPLVTNESGITELNTADLNHPVEYAASQDINKLNCTSLEPGAVRDPINPCYAVDGNITVMPLEQEIAATTPQAA